MNNIIKRDSNGLHCERCGSVRLDDGRCQDETCPFSDHQANCPAGWNGHSERDPLPNDDTAVASCTCKTNANPLQTGE